MSVALALLAAVFVACGGSEERSRVVLEIAPISAIAATATQDADADTIRGRLIWPLAPQSSRRLRGQTELLA